MLHIDYPPVAGEDEALFLMLYHLKMAAALFEGTPKVIPATAASEEFSAAAIDAWLKEMERLYTDD
jgi:hypothetical protein